MMSRCVVLLPAVGKVDGVRASNNTVTVIVLLLLESSAAVVISHSVGVLVGRGLGQIVSNISGLHGGVVSGGVVDNGGRSVVRGSVVDNRGGMSNWVNGVMGNWVDSMVGDGVDGMVGNGVDGMVGDGVDGMVSNWVTNNSMMTNNMVGSVQPVGG